MRSSLNLFFAKWTDHFHSLRLLRGLKSPPPPPPLPPHTHTPVATFTIYYSFQRFFQILKTFVCVLCHPRMRCSQNVALPKKTSNSNQATAPSSEAMLPPRRSQYCNSIQWGPVRITSWHPEFNGSHFGLPPSPAHKMTGLGGKMVWTITYTHRHQWWFCIELGNQKGKSLSPENSSPPRGCMKYLRPTPLYSSSGVVGSWVGGQNEMVQCA